jgi:catechol 2,3-dioxygenase-like lactoylglutathione lyase family enzyme
MAPNSSFRFLKFSIKIPGMARVRGIGGIFFKSKDPEALYAWYKQHLGISADPQAGAFFRRDESSRPEDMTIWAIFPLSTRYFDPSPAPFMLNYIVDDLEGLLKTLREEGVEVDPKMESHEYGKFGWIRDPDGNRIELWEPMAAEQPSAPNSI